MPQLSTGPEYDLETWATCPPDLRGALNVVMNDIYAAALFWELEQVSGM